MLNKNTLKESLIESFDFYMKDCKSRGQRETTLEDKKYRLIRFVEWAVDEGLTKPRDITEDVLSEYEGYLRCWVNPRTGDPLQSSTVRVHMSRVCDFMSRLYIKRIIDENPSERYEKPKADHTLPKDILTMDEIERILMQPKYSSRNPIRDRAILELCFATGIRRREVANLNLQDIDFDRKMVSVNNGKGGKDRRVPIADRALKWIRAYMRQERPERATLESGSSLFLTMYGKPMTDIKVGEMVGKHIRRSGVRTKGSTHLFRHSLATDMLNNNADLRFVQQMLGHASISTTQVYTHVAIGKLQDVYNQTAPAATGEAA